MLLLYTALAPDIFYTTNNQVQEFFWDEEFEECPYVDNTVSSSPSCGNCVRSGNRLNCTDGEMGAECTVNITVTLCEVVVAKSVLTVNISSFSTTEVPSQASSSSHNGKYSFKPFQDTTGESD